MAMQIETGKGFLVCLAGPFCAMEQEERVPFNGAKEAIELLVKVADVVELVSTNSRAARSEWSSAGLPMIGVLPVRRRDVSVCLSELMGRGYEPRCCLLIGCGKKDLAAAQELHALFFPMLPGQEAGCWRELVEEGLPKLLHGTYMGAYQQRLVARHNSLLREG